MVIEASKMGMLLICITAKIMKNGDLTDFTVKSEELTIKNR
jgi:hypothetical protein